MAGTLTDPGNPVAAHAKQAALNFDLKNLPAGFYQDPFPVYHALMRYDPVHRNPDGSYLLTRYDDIAFVYRDRRFSSDKQKLFRPKFGDSPLYTHHTTSLVFNDPPYHTRVRRLIAGAVKPKVVKSMETGLIRLVDGLLDNVERRHNFDAIDDFAALIPVEVIGNLLSIPHSEREPLRAWSLAILGALEFQLSKPAELAGNLAVTEFREYLRALVTRRQKDPGDDETDVLSCLIRGENGEKLGEEELLQNCIFILNAGHETTTNLIGNGIYELLRHPAELTKLRQQPDLAKSAVEEILRYQSPNQLGNREVVEELHIGDVRMAPGTQITLGIGAANRDPSHFENPDHFDITRSPNNHLAFASGIHMCIGMSLARLEGRIALERLTHRFPRLRVAGTPAHRERARFRGFSSLPLAIE